MARRTGANPTAIIHCTLPHCCSQPIFPTRPVNPKKIAATAAKESQKPAESTASGSQTTTNSRAVAIPLVGLGGLLSRYPETNTSNIIKARCVGRAKPAMAAYTAAPIKPEIAPACWAGSRSGSLLERLQILRMMKKISPNTIPMCSLDIAIRWLVSVRANSSHWD